MNHADLIVARIERARQERGISVAELARRVGVDRLVVVVPPARHLARELRRGRAVDDHEAGSPRDGARGKLQEDPNEVRRRHAEPARELLGRGELPFGHAQVHLLGAPFQTAARLLGTWA